MTAHFLPGPAFHVTRLDASEDRQLWVSFWGEERAFDPPSHQTAYRCATSPLQRRVQPQSAHMTTPPLKDENVCGRTCLSGMPEEPFLRFVFFGIMGRGYEQCESISAQGCGAHEIKRTVQRELGF